MTLFLSHPYSRTRLIYTNKRSQNLKNLIMQCCCFILRLSIKSLLLMIGPSADVVRKSTVTDAGAGTTGAGAAFGAACTGCGATTGVACTGAGATAGASCSPTGYSSSSCSSSSVLAFRRPPKKQV
eukprot:gnl/TRDRNA2_/TRDRNA2_154965_c0_seq1.p1 gnl/TRDRNA2_/TRDRNA2_154965_c0~~gnl/TRDRNA2_/TRDRNA2_154965_c0_seq1.p1  ORF type:complete len:126 (-),score=1.13 gnl/TRDRNA2_/TRDRNA2_154965_c0_seq1:33-410(-)